MTDGFRSMDSRFLISFDGGGRLTRDRFAGGFLEDDAEAAEWEVSEFDPEPDPASDASSPDSLCDSSPGVGDFDLAAIFARHQYAEGSD